MNNVVQCVDMEVLAQSENCSVYKVSSSSGDGIMTMYSVFDGISVSYNDFHIHEFHSGFITKENVLCIDHCREGRMEKEIDKNKRMYMSSGDLRIDDRSNHSGNFYLPLGHYHGITVIFIIDEAEKSIKELFPDFPVNIQELKDKFCGEYPMIFLRKNRAISHVFHEMYNIPKEIRMHYLKVKVIELILFLYSIDVKNSVEERPYFYKSHTEKVKQIYNMMISDLKKKYTLNELSEMYGIPLTTMKNCFKEIYGDPISTFMRKYRINQATNLLITSDLSISEIAYSMGYESPSKFSIAFKKEMEVSPAVYRNNRRISNEK